MDEVHVQVGEQRVALADIALVPGKVVDLGRVALRVDGKHSFRVVGFRAKGAKNTWWLATNLEDPPTRILSLYDRRMTIEEQFRDLKGKRFGVKLAWTHFRDPAHLARFLLLLGVALLIWLLTGAVAARRTPSLRLVCKTKGPRQSFVTLGLRACALDPPISFSLAQLRRWLEPPTLRKLSQTTPGGK